MSDEKPNQAPPPQTSSTKPIICESVGRHDVYARALAMLLIGESFIFTAMLEAYTKARLQASNTIVSKKPTKRNRRKAILAPARQRTGPVGVPPEGLT